MGEERCQQGGTRADQCIGFIDPYRLRKVAIEDWKDGMFRRTDDCHAVIGM